MKVSEISLVMGIVIIFEKLLKVIKNYEISEKYWSGILKLLKNV